MEKIYTTSDGISLYADENKLYSESPNKVVKSLQKDIQNRDLKGLISAEILEEGYANGIEQINRKFWLFSSDSPDESGVSVLIFASKKRAFAIAQRMFVRWGYLGNPVAII